MTSMKKFSLTDGKPKEVSPIGILSQGRKPTGNVVMVICTLDYQGTGHELTCHYDGDNIQELAQACGITNIYRYKDTQCTKDNVMQTIQSVCSGLTDQDTFIFFFAGHGTSIRDVSGDETDGQDEAYVLVDEAGQIDIQNTNLMLLDDELAMAITSGVGQARPNILVISDCCHSGTMCDFDSHMWRGFQAVSISGCKDAQTSGDFGQGGICTASLCLAVESFVKEGRNDYSVYDLYRRTIRFDDDVFKSEQDITVSQSPNFRPKDMTWPLIPNQPYTAPYTRLHGPQQLSSMASQISAAPMAAASPFNGAPMAAPVVQPSSYKLPQQVPVVGQQGGYHPMPQVRYTHTANPVSPGATGNYKPMPKVHTNVVTSQAYRPAAAISAVPSAAYYQPQQVRYSTGGIMGTSGMASTAGLTSPSPYVVMQGNPMPYRM